MQEFKPMMLPEGQFIAVWEHNGRIWSEVFNNVDGELVRYCSENDEWLSDDFKCYENFDPKLFTV